MERTLDGVTVALLTAIHPDGSIDREGISRLVRAARDGGVTGISPLGSTGEGYSLPLARRLEVVDSVVESFDQPGHVIPGVFAHNSEQAATEITAYAEHGATAVLVAPPCYYPLSASEQKAYFQTVADAAVAPIVLYNIPPLTKISLVPSVVAELAVHPRIIGIKDSSRDFGYHLEVLDGVARAGIAPEKFSVLTGTDSMFVACLAAGARGCIVASANVAPKLPVGVYRAMVAGDLDEARRVEYQLRRVLDACRIGVAPSGIKAAAALIGRCGPAMVAPRQQLAPDVEVRIRAALDELGITVSQG
jgi:dihydrodipicolinate synthase/N-acetylneuraminate lyase